MAIFLTFSCKITPYLWIVRLKTLSCRRIWIFPRRISFLSFLRYRHTLRKISSPFSCSQLNIRCGKSRKYGRCEWRQITKLTYYPSPRSYFIALSLWQHPYKRSKKKNKNKNKNETLSKFECFYKYARVIINYAKKKFNLQSPGHSSRTLVSAS